MFAERRISINIARLRRASTNEDRLEAYPPGAVIVLLGNTSHFHWAKSGDYIAQVTAIGPPGFEYLNSTDESTEEKFTEV